VTRDIDESSENVLSEWSRRVAGEGTPAEDDPEPPVFEEDETPPPSSYESDDAPDESGESGESAAWGAADPHGQVAEAEEAEAGDAEVEDEDAGTPMAVAPSSEHAVGELEIPDGYAVLEGYADGTRRAVGVVVARFNGGVTSRLLERALEELESSSVPRDAITVMVVPGAFELPLAATALAKTRRFACIVALGCVIRGDTPHFDYVASEAASGLQLAALETGVPVSFGLLTLDRIEQAEPRVEKGAEAVRTALEMADLFSHLRAAASR
jgi:6,7-dimethyl-8-ribityllumazine synthase